MQRPLPYHRFLRASDSQTLSAGALWVLGTVPQAHQGKNSFPNVLRATALASYIAMRSSDIIPTQTNHHVPALNVPSRAAVGARRLLVVEDRELTLSYILHKISIIIINILHFIFYFVYVFAAVLSRPQRHTALPKTRARGVGNRQPANSPPPHMGPPRRQRTPPPTSQLRRLRVFSPPLPNHRSLSGAAVSIAALLSWRVVIEARRGSRFGAHRRPAPSVGFFECSAVAAARALGIGMATRRALLVVSVEASERVEAGRRDDDEGRTDAERHAGDRLPLPTLLRVLGELGCSCGTEQPLTASGPKSRAHSGWESAIYGSPTLTERRAV
ncbi:hypothetical protein BD410DRAFT_838996 [Rickenella mellea]|uniref:Uncharacterized protein n=1 Tax=Rickenella mellea TaxID=50990 RepID=A0A4Y7Q9I4_9AGAM|nr:hypothetical protein BD410DRAFT_838996 [Rickenella mellea]